MDPRSPSSRSHCARPGSWPGQRRCDPRHGRPQTGTARAIRPVLADHSRVTRLGDHRARSEGAPSGLECSAEPGGEGVVMPRRKRVCEVEERGVGTFGGRWRSTAVITVGALVASLCLIAAPAGAATKPTGSLTVEAPGVTVLKKGSTGFTKGKTNQKVGIGDTIQTDASGLAELKYSDGSITRLDHGSVFTIDKLVNKTGQRQVQGTVSAGQTWNRVQKLSENGTFQQKGNGATATTVGTAFVTKCSLPAGTAFTVVKTKKQLKKLQKASKCDFTLVDGKLALTSLGKNVAMTAGQSTSVDASGNAGDAVTVPPGIFFSDQWITTNLDLDAKAGIDEARGTPTAENLKRARIDGTWTVTLTVSSTTGFRDLANGGVKTRTYTFNGSSSGVTVTAQTANGSVVIPLAYADGVYSGNADLGVQNCELDNGTVAVVNGIHNTQTVSLSATGAVPQSGLWSANALGGTVTENADQIAGAAGQCLTGSATFALTASR